MQAPAADINIRDNYLNFINKSVSEYNTLEKKAVRLLNTKKEAYEYLNPRKEDIYKYFDIILSERTDFVMLFDKVNKMFRKNDNPERRILLIQLVKYCNVCKLEIDIYKRLALVNKKKNLSFADYRDYVYKYYSKVHKFLLEGKGYKYMNKIGTLYIERVQIEGSGTKINFAATRKRKEELIAKGVKLYNRFEAQKAEQLGVEYDGVDYRVWLNVPALYKLKFINSRYFTQDYDFFPVDYIHAKYREFSQDQLAFEVCKTPDDVFNLRCDLRNKIAIYLKKYPERFIDLDRRYKTND